MNVFTPRAIRIAAASLLAALTLALAPGCSTLVARPDAVRSADAHDGLGCTPLALIVMAEGERGVGSGVLVHPRVVLTALHVVPDDPELLAVATAASSRRPLITRIARVVDGGGRPAGSGDWALLVLEAPLEDFAAASVDLSPDQPDARRKSPVWVAGYPEGVDDVDWPAPLLLRTKFIKRPEGAPVEPAVRYARNSKGQTGYLGASGGPALAPGEDGRTSLVGIYLGTLERSFGGVLVDREILIHTLPLDEIRWVIAEVEAEGN